MIKIMKKRGISPLVATVLLLGFTVALAAVIMTWGQGFTRDIQKTTEETSNIQVICATDVVFDIDNACEVDANTVRVVIKNDGARDIDSFKARLYRSGSDVSTANVTGVSAFGIKSKDISKTGTIKLVELLPVITVGGKSITCSQNSPTYGDLDGVGLAAC